MYICEKETCCRVLIYNLDLCFFPPSLIHFRRQIAGDMSNPKTKIDNPFSIEIISFTSTNSISASEKNRLSILIAKFLNSANPTHKLV